jgi:hypothetical protein
MMPTGDEGFSDFLSSLEASECSELCGYEC